MKVISALIAMALSAVAAPSDPGETAVHFLEKVRSKSLNLEPGTDTALSPHTSAAKRKEIARRLDRMARDLGSDPLEVGAVKLDGDLGAVLVRKISGFDPNRMQVFPIALVKRGAEWTVAPVPASFENSGVGYAAALRERLKTLEDWMLRERVLDLAALRDQSADRMRHNIEAVLPAATLRGFSAKQAAERFLQASETRNLPEMFGLLGGLATSQPENWQIRVKAAERAVAAGANATYPWRLLVSADVVRSIVHHEEDARSGLVSIACLDPGGAATDERPRIRLVHLDLTKSHDGLWRINPPGYFLQEDDDSDDDTDEDLDSDLLDVFPSKLRETYPPSPRPTPEDARQAVISAVRNDRLPPLISVTRLNGDPSSARESCIRAAQLWRTFHEASSARHAVPLGLREDGENAAATFQIFSARNPDRFDFQVLYFLKSADGWLWTPKPNPEIERSFSDWTGLQADQWKDEWQNQLLSDCPVLEKLPEGGAPSKEKSRELIESWLQAVRTGDISAALRLTARLNLPDSKATLLRNLGYELIGARKHKLPPAIMDVYSGQVWSAVGIRIDSESTFPLYPVITTTAGLRILPEIDLSASDKRSRDFLNKTSLKRLGAFGPAAATELNELFSQHRAAVLPTDPP